MSVRRKHAAPVANRASPLRRMRDAGRPRIRTEEIAAYSGQSIAVVLRLDRMRKLENITLGKLLAVSEALGCAPCELVPALARRPKGGGGLLVERGVIRPKRVKE